MASSSLTPSEAATLEAEAGDVEGAIARLRGEIAGDAANASTWLALGSVLSGAGRWEEAVSALREAVDLDEDVAVARVLLARALEGTGKADDAVFQLLKASKLAPDDPAVLRELGGAFYRKGLYDKALQWLLKARAAASGDPKEEARALYAIGPRPGGAARSRGGHCGLPGRHRTQQGSSRRAQDARGRARQHRRARTSDRCPGGALGGRPDERKGRPPTARSSRGRSRR